MICYLLLHSSLWDNPSITNGKRNVRILWLGLVFYIILHAFTSECYNFNIGCRLVYSYFWWIIATDILLCACEYRIFYGRTILNELKEHETDVYDEKTHKYISADKIISTDKTIPTDKIIPIIKNDDIDQLTSSDNSIINDNDQYNSMIVK
jgi:hypothetical protein